MVIATTCALVALSPGAKATPTASLTLYAGQVGEGPGLEIGQLAQAVSAGASNVLSSHATRRIVRSLDRSTGIQTAFAGNAGVGPHANVGLPAREVSMAVNDIERKGSDVYLAVDTSDLILRVDAAGLITLRVPGVSTLGIAVADDGTIYYGDSARDSIHRRLPDGTTQLIAGSATGASGYADGDGTAALFNGIRDVALSGNTLYVADHLNFRVRAVNLSSPTFTVSTVAGNGTNDLDTAYSGPALGGGFRGVLGLDMLNSSDLLVATGDGGSVRVVHIGPTPAENSMERIAGGGSVRVPTTLPGGDPLTANFGRAYDVSVAPDGAVAIGGDLGLFMLEGGLVRRVAGNYTSGRAGDGLAATDPITSLFVPRDVATDTAGNTYIADFGNNSIRKVDAAGVISRFAGPAETFGAPPLGDGGPATAANMSPAGIAVDRQGVVYVADPLRHRVRRIGLDGIITTIAGTGVAGSAGDGGPAAAAQLDAPWSVAVDSTGAVYVTEVWQTRVRRIAGGTITTVYDAPGTSNPSVGRSATRGLAVGPDDSVYVTDQETSQIRRLPPGGGASEVVVGNGITNPSSTTVGDGQLATATAVYLPVSVAVDHENNIFFNDHCTVRRVDHVTRTLSTVAGTRACGVSGLGGPARAASFGTPSGIAFLGTDLIFSDESSHRVYSVADVVAAPAPPEADVLSGKIAFDTQRYAGGPGNREIAVANADGTDVRRLTNAAGHDSDPDFSADGSHIAWTSDRVGNHDVWVMKSDGSDQTNLTAGSGLFEADASWSPAGDQIAFTRDAGGSYDLIMKNADGTGEANLTAAFNSRTAAAPDWFPDGSAIAVQSQDHLSGDFDIYRVPTDGVSAPTVILSTPANESEPQVSPDGSKIVYMSNAGGNNDIWIMNADGTNQMRLTNDPGAEFLPTFSPDGKYIVFNDNTNELRRMRADSADQVYVFETAQNDFAASWVDNLTISVGTPTVVAQPATVEGAEVLLQPQAPVLQAAAGQLALINILGSPGLLGLVNILGSPGLLGLVNILGSPGGQLGLVNILGSPGGLLGLVNILGSPGLLGLVNILGSPGLDAALDEISVLSIPIDGGWEAFFADGEPVQSKSLLDALKTGKQVPLFDLTINDSPLANVSLFSFFLGQVALRELTKDAAVEQRWCDTLEALDDAFVADGTQDGADCGAARFGAPGRTNGLGTTLMELQLQGVPLASFPELASLRFSDISFDLNGTAAGDPVDTPFERTHLNNIDLALSDLGAITMEALAAKNVRDLIVDCDAAEGICGAAETLAFAQDQGAIRPDAMLQKLLPVIADYNALLTLIGLLPPEVRPLQALNPESDVFAAVDEPGVNDVEYSVAFSPVGVANAREATVSVSLPTGFVPVLGSATLSLDGAAAVPVPMRSNGRTMRARLEGITIPAGSNGVLTFRARPGQTLSEGRRVSASITAPGIEQAIGGRAGIAITERFEPENNFPDTPTTPTLVPDTLYLTHIAEPGDVDYFRLPLQAGDRVRILLDQPKPDVAGGNADLDLVVYAPPGAATAPLRATVDSNEAIVPVFDNPNRLGEPVRPDVVQDVALLPKPVAALSTNRGTFNEGVTVLAPVTGNYVVQVAGYNGASSSRPYSLQSTREIGEPIPTCGPRSFSSSGPLGTSTTVESTDETLVLVNQSRLYSKYDALQVDALMAQVHAFAGHASVNGAVISVDAFENVRDAYAAWDTDACSVDLANDVVRQINTAVDTVVDLRARKIKHIVVVGNDDVIPSARIPDLTQTANERNYADSLRLAGGSEATISALVAGNVLSDDPYGDGAPAPYLGRHLYVSDVGIGRLVESPTEIEGQLTNYLGTFNDSSSTNDGRLDKSTAFTAGYDFMKDVSTEIDSKLDTLTGASPSASNQLISDGWNAADLRAKFTSASPAPDLVSLNAHFTHKSLDPPQLDPSDPAGRVTTEDVRASSASGNLLFTMGCHSGLNVPDIIVGAPETRDWAQALSAKQSTFVGQTGFGYGLQDAIALSEDIMLGFTKNLTTSMTVGQALTFAKHDYLGGLGVYGVYDEKALAQATMYGLPNWKVGTGAVPGTGPSLPTSVDERTGLKAAAFDHSETFTPRTSANGTYWSGSGGTQVTQDRPIQPKSELDVTQSGLVAHGAEITGLTSDELAADAVYASVVLDDSTRETEVENPTAVFPAGLQRINDFTTPSGERQRLVLLTGQYRASGADADGDVTGVQRLYRRMAGKVHYSTSTDFTPPKILSTGATEVGEGVSFAVGVDDALGATTIKAVSVLYHAVGEGDAGSDVWTRLSLARDPSDATRWLGTGGAATDGDGDELEYLVVALDHAGNTAYSTRKGAFFAAASPPPAPPHVSAAVVGQPTASGWYPSATVELTGEDDTTFEYSVDGGPWQPYEAPIPVTGDGTHRVEYRTDDGASGEVVVPIDTTGPTVTITSPANQSYAQGAIVFADFACADQGSGVATCEGTVADGAPIDTSSAGTKTFTVTATDGAGHTTSEQVTYTVTSGVVFDGFFSPVKNAPAINKTSAGSTVPVKWKLFHASGAPITDPGSVTKIVSYPIKCDSSRTRIGTSQEVTTLAKNTVVYDAAKQQFVFNWKTKSGWVGSCRQLQLTFSGGLQKSADFQFGL